MVPLGVGVTARVTAHAGRSCARGWSWAIGPWRCRCPRDGRTRTCRGCSTRSRRCLRRHRPVLVLPGYATGHEADLQAAARGARIAGDVRMTGWFPAADVEGLYALASLFVFPSLYEGFGLPVLEAMCRGVPVACSNTSSLPEVAGDAALLFDPHDTGQMAAAIRRLLVDSELAQTLVARGRGQCARFSWRAMAEGTIAAYERAMSLPT